MLAGLLLVQQVAKDLGVVYLVVAQAQEQLLETRVSGLAGSLVIGIGYLVLYLDVSAEHICCFS